MQLHSCRWLKMASTVSEQCQPAQGALAGCWPRSLSSFSVVSVPSDAMSTRLLTCLGGSLELTCSMCFLSPNAFLIHSKPVSSSGKYLPSWEWRPCRCSLKAAAVLPSSSSSAVRRKFASVGKQSNSWWSRRGHHNSILRCAALILFCILKTVTLFPCSPEDIRQVCQFCKPLEIMHSVIQFISMRQE